MLQKFACFLTNRLLKSQTITWEQKEVYQYGFELLLSTILNMIIVITIGLLFGSFWLSVLFLLVFIPTRMCCGGFHADSYLVCNVVFGSVFFCVLCSYRLMVSTPALNSLIIILNIISIVSAIFFAPVRNPHKVLSEEKRKKFKVISVLLFTGISILSTTLACLNMVVGTFLSIEMFSITILILVGILKQEVMKHEEHEKSHG